MGMRSGNAPPLLLRHVSMAAMEADKSISAVVFHKICRPPAPEARAPGAEPTPEQTAISASRYAAGAKSA